MKGQHSQDNHPVREAICHKCHRKGHYIAQCLSKTVAEVGQSNESNLDTAFLDETSTGQGRARFANIQLGEREMLTFKLDTGVEVTATSESCYQKLSHPTPLNTPDRVLCGPSKQPRGQCNLQLSFKGRVCKQQVFIVKGLNNNLLGLPAIISLNLARRLDKTSTTTSASEDVHQHYPSLFLGLGNLGDDYEIKLKPDATPHVLYTPRHVPIPLRAKVTEELNRMEEMGVISKVKEQTEWCAGMVVVLKKSGAVHICVNLKLLNTSVTRSVRHPSPTDWSSPTNSGFWQIPLLPVSRLLTTFITLSGRYCYNKLPFGIASAPEHFQRRMNSIFHGLDCVCVKWMMSWYSDETKNSMTDAFMQRYRESKQRGLHSTHRSVNSPRQASYSWDTSSIRKGSGPILIRQPKFVR